MYKTLPVVHVVNYLKSISILLIAALANPFCCCLAIGSSLDELEAKSQESAAHSCCSQSVEADQPESDSAADHKDCQHRIDKQSQIVDIDAGAHAVHKTVAVALFELPLTVDQLVNQSASVQGTAFVLNTSVLPSGRARTQVNCSYLL